MNKTTLEQIMSLYTQDLLRTSYYYTKNIHTAQDIVQDVFIRFYHKNPALKDEDVKRYLMRMVINQSKDYLRSWHARKMKFIDYLSLPETKSSMRKIYERETEDELSDAVFSLPLKNREAIVYYYFENLTTKEIASILKLPESTVKSRLSKGRILLKEKLKAFEWEAMLHD